MPSARAIAFTVAFLLAPAAALGQGVRWESTGTVEFGGALGVIARLVGGGGETVTKYALQDGRSLYDSESSGTIYDYGAGTFTVIDHEDRSYFTTSFADMAQALEAQAVEARERIDEARAEAGDATTSVEQSDVDLGVKVSVDRPGDRQTIAGYEAERFIVTVELGGASSAGESPTSGGSLVLLSDVWTSRDFPADRIIRETLEANPDWANLEDLREAGAGIQEAFAFDGRIKVAMEASAAELEEMGGHALLSRTSVLLVPPGVTLDPAAVFSAYDQPLGPDVKNAAAGAAKDAAADAVRSALGSLGFGKKQEPEAAKEPDPVQTVIMRVTDRVTAVQEGDLPPQTFQPPAGYQQRTPEWLKKD